MSHIRLGPREDVGIIRRPDNQAVLLSQGPLIRQSVDYIIMFIAILNVDLQWIFFPLRRFVLSSIPNKTSTELNYE